MSGRLSILRLAVEHNFGEVSKEKHFIRMPNKSFKKNRMTRECANHDFTEVSLKTRHPQLFTTINE